MHCSMLNLTDFVFRFKLILKKIVHFYKSPFFFRILAIWVVSIFILIAEIGLKNYDTRFKLRSLQNIDQNIIILTVSQAEWDEVFKPSLLKSMIYRQEPVTDSYYWNQGFWIQTIQNLKQMGVHKVGIDFYFSKSLNLNWGVLNYLSQIPDVYWISNIDSFGRLLPSKFSNNFNENIGINLLRTDYDGILRNFYFSSVNIPQLPEILSYRWPKIYNNTQEQLINFRGPPGTFPIHPLFSAFDGTLKKVDLKNKTVIIAPEYGKDHLIKTPLGIMNRSEIYANIIDNINHNRWIKKWPIYIYAAFILPMILICVWVILSFPQGVGVTLLTCLAFISISMSIFLFDIYYIWTPMITLLSCLFMSYVIIISQMLLEREKNVWQMQKEQDYLKSLEELKSNFVSLISHDLKTPLAKIQSVIHRLRNTSSTNSSLDLKEDLNSIYTESKHLDRYIKSILKLLKIESKDFTIIKKPLDVNEVINTACSQLAPIAEEKSISFNLNLEPMFLIEADKTLVLEIMINLIENAIKYSFPNTKISISSFEKNNYVNIEVADQGPGIKEEHLNLIFEKFYRGETTTAAQGTGLGLFLVKYFIELHNGLIDIKSVLGHGTTIIVKLPTEV